MPIKIECPQGNEVSAKTVFRFEVRLLSGPLSPAFVAKHPTAPERVIDIRGSQTLDDLHWIIFKAFDREDTHMYEFQIGGKKPMDRKSMRYGVALDDEFDEDGGEDSIITTIADLGLKTGSFFSIGSILAMIGGMRCAYWR